MKFSSPSRRWILKSLLFSTPNQTRNATQASQCKHNALINVKPAGRGSRAWGGDLIVFVGPGVGHLTDLVLPGEGIFESFFARHGDFLLPTRTKKTETEHMFSTSTLYACAVRFKKIRKSWRPMNF